MWTVDRHLVVGAIDDVRTLRLRLSALANNDGTYERAAEVAALGAELLSSVEDRLREALADGQYRSWPPRRE
jgi:hypothetical protein